MRCYNRFTIIIHARLEQSDHLRNEIKTRIEMAISSFMTTIIVLFNRNISILLLFYFMELKLEL